MSEVVISDAVRYIGCDDHEIDLFESQYRVPHGVSYNSYLIVDEKTAIMDTVDARTTEEWLANLERELDSTTQRRPDYLVVSHLEPDHAANIQKVCEKYPELMVVGSAKTFAMLPQFFTMDFSGRKVEVKEGDTLCLGRHTLRFYMAPMVHWPEVMVSYEETENILFSADGFGKFGTLDTQENWDCEARRYYMNIVGKYGAPVQALLKKAAALDIQIICPLHGPVLKENLSHYLEKYEIWSSYLPEDAGVTIAFASIHGNTAAAARELAALLEEKGQKVSLFDLARDDMAEAVEDAFRYDRLVLAAATYDGGLFPCMEDFLYHLKLKNYQKRTVGILENGSWAPMAGKLMKEYVENFKDCVLAEPVVTVKSVLNTASREQLGLLADTLAKTE
ncbi:MAG: FprA family A-type flavoprotein [Lachnospiraceae bacterium]|nr:FprA family A-type flavoprotein [Lachnospiraceae bacterium]